MENRYDVCINSCNLCRVCIISLRNRDASIIEYRMNLRLQFTDEIVSRDVNKAYSTIHTVAVLINTNIRTS